MVALIVVDIKGQLAMCPNLGAQYSHVCYKKRATSGCQKAAHLLRDAHRAYPLLNQTPIVPYGRRARIFHTRLQSVNGDVRSCHVDAPVVCLSPFTARRGRRPVAVETPIPGCLPLRRTRTRRKVRLGLQTGRCIRSSPSSNSRSGRARR